MRQRYQQHLEIERISVVESMDNGSNELRRLVEDGSQCSWDVAMCTVQRFTTLARVSDTLHYTHLISQNYSQAHSVQSACLEKHL